MEEIQNTDDGRKQELPTVFAFLDHRLFLREWFEAKKALSHSYSYRVFARRAGFASHAFLSEVMQGRRNLSEDSVEKFLKALALGKEAADYFRLLVRYGQEAIPGRKEELLGDLVRIQATLAVGHVGRKQEAYYSHWIHAVVRELAVQLPDCKPEDIASRLAPAATSQEVEDSLSLLESLGLLSRTREGTWNYGVSARLTPGDVPQQVLQALKRQYFLLVQDRIVTGDADAHASSVILSASRSRMARIRAALDNLRREILAETANDDDPVERVLLVNFQMVPLTRKLQNNE